MLEHIDYAINFDLFFTSSVLKEEIMLFMIIERFRDNDMLPVYKRIQDEGRMFPDGLTYINSWVEPNFSRCFQLMECDDLCLLQEWILKWRGFGIAFEVVPVLSSADTQAIVDPLSRATVSYLLIERAHI